jgi:hypothetical protein
MLMEVGIINNHYPRTNTTRLRLKKDSIIGAIKNPFNVILHI